MSATNLIGRVAHEDGQDAVVEVDNISRRFGSKLALDNVSLEVPAGELLALLGPSGSGKTTLLRIVAGLETADRGTVRYADEDVTTAPVRERASLQTWLGRPA